MSVAGKVDLRIIYRSLNGFRQLEELHFPIHTTHYEITNLRPCPAWPKTLKRLYLAGMIDYSHSLYKGGFPSTLTHLTVERCPGVRKEYILRWLKSTGRNLEFFEVSGRCPDRNSGEYLDDIIKFMPRLRQLKISHEHISESFFKFQSEDTDVPRSRIKHHSLEHLELGCQDSFALANPANLKASMVFDAFCFGFGNLKVFRYHRRLGWSDEPFERHCLSVLCSAMAAKAEARGNGEGVSVIMFHGQGLRAIEEKMDRSNMSSYRICDSC